MLDWIVLGMSLHDLSTYRLNLRVSVGFLIMT